MSRICEIFVLMPPSIYATPRATALAARVRDFVENELFALETPEHLTGLHSRIALLLESKRALVKAAGLWGLAWDKEAGGHGLTLCEFGQISEEMGRTPWGHFVFNCQAPDIGNMELLHRHGSPEQRERWLHPLMAGAIRSCFAMTEPEFAGSNPTRLGATAERDGDAYLINAHKWFTTGADGAAFAIVMAVTDPDAPPHLRASQIIVPTDTPGFRMVRNLPVMGESGDGWSSHAEIVLENCRVPPTHLIGTQGHGFLLAQERLGPGRIHHCMRWIGISERCLDILCRRAVSRSIGDGKVLADQQLIQSYIAHSRAEIDSARLHVLNTAWLIDQQGTATVRDAISAIKFTTANMMLRVVDRTIQTLGAWGVTDDLIPAFWYRHERGARIYDGADEVHITSLAKSVLKKYRV